MSELKNYRIVCYYPNGNREVGPPITFEFANSWIEYCKNPKNNNPSDIYYFIERIE